MNHPSLISWQSCQVETYRFQGIGRSRSRRGSDSFLTDMFLIARYGERNDREEIRRVYAADPETGNLRRIGPEHIDWTGFAAALSERHPQLLNHLYPLERKAA